MTVRPFIDPTLLLLDTTESTATQADNTSSAEGKAAAADAAVEEQTKRTQAVVQGLEAQTDSLVEEAMSNGDGATMLAISGIAAAALNREVGLFKWCCYCTALHYTVISGHCSALHCTAL